MHLTPGAHKAQEITAEDCSLTRQDSTFAILAKTGELRFLAFIGTLFIPHLSTELGTRCKDKHEIQLASASEKAML